MIKYYIIYKMDMNDEGFEEEHIVAIVENETIAYHFCYVVHPFSGYRYQEVSMEDKKYDIR